ncbi:MAG: sulfotransferase domain-containing protein [Rhodospirillales bacterium]|jgi:aryl sulfotransferase|nr:sulfotransferase domain-containing protein [Rhodospirillales bacterium]MDP6645883.1 sulfotransferase domain-containing protein [Rhodospirillales bacterium]|tara:strand:- start:1189 stop:2100 length:912 start_codon:yes stop_codon:yes gene_type:complete
MDQKIEWPEKTREIQNWAMDSTHWDDFEFRDDDIIIGTWQKAGTTWVQQIIAQFIFNGDTEGLPIADISPWFDFRLPPLEEVLPGIIAQKHRRFLKTHLPVDALVYSPKAKYIYIARDGRDCIWSLFNHHLSWNDLAYELLNSRPEFGPGPERLRSEDVREYYLDWFNDNDFPFWSFWENVRTWWAIRDLPNIYFLHFQNLRDDMEGQMRKLAAFLDIAIDESKWDLMVHHCSFEYMKNNATLSTPLGGIVFEGGAKTFIHKGTNNRWRDTLTAADIEAYEARVIDEVGAECAHWLATGEFLK